MYLTIVHLFASLFSLALAAVWKHEDLLNMGLKLVFFVLAFLFGIEAARGFGLF